MKISDATVSRRLSDASHSQCSIGQYKDFWRGEYCYSSAFNVNMCLATHLLVHDITVSESLANQNLSETRIPDQVFLHPRASFFYHCYNADPVAFTNPSTH
jgi:hypothetical protein